MRFLHIEFGRYTPTRPTPASNAPDGDFYAALMASRIHHDQQSWGTVQLLIAVQGAILATAYQLRASWLAQLIVGVGLVLSVALLFLHLKHERDRDTNTQLMDALARALTDISLPAHIAQGLPPAVFSKAPHWAFGVRGRFVLRFSIVLFLAVDLGFLACLLWAPDLLPTPTA